MATTLTTPKTVSTAPSVIGAIGGPKVVCYIFNDSSTNIMRVLIDDGDISSDNFTHEIPAETGWQVPKGIYGPITAQMTAGTALAMVTLSDG